MATRNATVAKPARAQTGRPSRFTQALADLICDRIADGESLRAICRSAGMPSKSIVLRWVIDDVNGFSDQYARARKLQADVLADEMTDIADRPPRLVETKFGTAVDPAWVALQRLRREGGGRDRHLDQEGQVVTADETARGGEVEGVLRELGHFEI